MKRVVSLLLVVSSVCAFGASISVQDALLQAENWMSSNPVMGPANRTIDSAEKFPEVGSYSVYVVRLSPKGYLVLNSDDRLPLIVGFSPDSGVDLTDRPDNGFRTMLETHVAKMEEELSKPIQATASSLVAAAVEAATEVLGPYLETAWNQNNPYNLYCPDAPDGGGTEYYGYRVPVGCVMTAYAQVMKFHNWPYHGKGHRSYTDSSGSCTGTHSADFSDSYDWASMLPGYTSGAGSNPAESEAAVAELMYELGVATGANYELAGTGASGANMGQRLGEYFYYEDSVHHSSYAATLGPMEAEIRAGYPCAIGVPGHQIIADGLMIDGGITNFHFNYGWGGSNNGWWTVDTTPLGAVTDGIVNLRPRLMAFPATNVVTVGEGGSVDLNWILPKRRETEAAQLTYYRLGELTELWTSNADTLPEESEGWEILPSSGRFTNECWYSGPGGGGEMVLDEIFVPDADTDLVFWLDYRLGTAAFKVSISSDDTATFTELYSASDRYPRSWDEVSIDLAAYAGQQIRVKFAIASGSYYSESGGVWIDDLSMTSGIRKKWMPIYAEDSLESTRYSAVETEIDDCDDFSVFELTTGNATYAGDWFVTNISDVGNCFYKASPEYGGYSYQLTMRSPVTPTSSSRLRYRAKYSLADDQFRLMISTDRTSFSEISTTADSVGWTDHLVDLSGYAGQDIFFRFEYIGSGGGYVGGGVWIDSVHIDDLTNPELEGQPIHHTTLPVMLAGTNLLRTTITDANGVEHAAGPEFKMIVIGDGDGMAGDWEVANGLDPSVNDGGLDPDGDGYSNFEEFICGTVPTNSASCWLLGRSTSALPNFQGQEGRRYTIDYCDNLLSGSWKTLVSGISGSNETVNVSDYESITNATRYYRVKVQREY